MLHFVSFGSGSSGNCSLLYTDDEMLILDAGVGVRVLKKHLKSYGLSIREALGILITHDHADHVRSVGCLSHDYALPVYTTVGAHEGITKNWSVRKKIEPDLVKVIEKGTSFKLGQFDITPFGIPHDSTDNVGYRIVCNGIVFVLMTDIGHLTDEMKSYISEANYLVIEADYEQQMPIDYLQGINNLYDEFIYKKYKGKVLVIEVDNLDFEHNPREFGEIVDRIDSQLFGLFSKEEGS